MSNLKESIQHPLEKFVKAYAQKFGLKLQYEVMDEGVVFLVIAHDGSFTTGLAIIEDKPHELLASFGDGTSPNGQHGGWDAVTPEHVVMAIKSGVAFDSLVSNYTDEDEGMGGDWLATVKNTQWNSPFDQN